MRVRLGLFNTFAFASLLLAVACSENPERDEKFEPAKRAKQILEGETEYQIDPSIPVPHEDYVNYPDALATYLKANPAVNLVIEPIKDEDDWRDDQDGKPDKMIDFESDPVFTSITRKYGNSRINIQEIHDNGGLSLPGRWVKRPGFDNPSQMIERFEPWSSYWYPDADPILYSEEMVQIRFTESRNTYRFREGAFFAYDKWALSRHERRMRELHSKDSLMEKIAIRKEIGEFYADPNDRKSRPDVLVRYETFIEDGGLSAAMFEKFFMRDNGTVPAWHGLCDAWAFASVLEPEPLYPFAAFLDRRERTNDTLAYFDVGDTKALVIKSYDTPNSDDFQIHGQKMSSAADTYNYPNPRDLFPNQLHRFVEEKVFGANPRPFLMDYKPNIEVWTVPVFAASIRYSPALDDNGRVIPDAVDVVLDLEAGEYFRQVEERHYSAANYEHPRTKKGNKTKTYTYAYRLFGNREGAILEVTGGVWLRGSGFTNSIANHPDYVIEIDDFRRGVRRYNAMNSPYDMNPYIDPAIVDEIKANSYEESKTPDGRNPLFVKVN